MERNAFNFHASLWSQLKFESLCTLIVLILFDVVLHENLSVLQFHHLSRINLSSPRYVRTNLFTPRHTVVRQQCDLSKSIFHIRIASVYQSQASKSHAHRRPLVVNTCPNCMRRAKREYAKYETGTPLIGSYLLHSFRGARRISGIFQSTVLRPKIWWTINR